MKQALKRITAILIVLLMLVGTIPVLAHQSRGALEIGTSLILAEENIKPLAKSDWTVCVYMCGTDLESGGSAATNALIEMLAADIPDDVTVLVWSLRFLMRRPSIL